MSLYGIALVSKACKWKYLTLKPLPLMKFYKISLSIAIRLLYACVVLISYLPQQALANVGNILKIYPAPKGAVLSSAFKVSAAGRPVSVYLAKVGAADPARRFKAVDDMIHSEQYFDNAAFAYFDMQGSATVTVTVSQAVITAKVLPASAGIKPVINGKSLSFKVSKPQNLTIEVNGETVKSLHLFVNPVDNNAPSPKDPNVIFFGPGIHEVSRMVVGDNKTIYLAGGAIVRAVIDLKEHYNIEPNVNFRTYEPTFELRGNHIKIRGRGILDASACTTHARSMILIQGNDISVEGIILLNSSAWTMPVRQSNNVLINNIKELGYRANTDGIDIMNSKNVTVQNCFIRTNDDLIVLKTDAGQGTLEHVVVKNCVLWNQLANALSLGFELRENVNDVTFTNCDIIHDTGRAWCLGIFQTDASWITNISFSNIRIEEAHQLITIWIGKANESFAKDLGHIQNLSFTNITAKGSPVPIDITGASSQSRVDNVSFKNVIVNSKPVSRAQVRSNQFTTNVTVQP
jgi:hypothetical protein